ncbi:unnamed protein product [Ectocarpus sp. 12 AP-2014]
MNVHYRTYAQHSSLAINRTTLVGNEQTMLICSGADTTNGRRELRTCVACSRFVGPLTRASIPALFSRLSLKTNINSQSRFFHHIFPFLSRLILAPIGAHFQSAVALQCAQHRMSKSRRARQRSDP